MKSGVGSQELESRKNIPFLIEIRHEHVTSPPFGLRQVQDERYMVGFNKGIIPVLIPEF
jgi:hypothetical protein